MFASGPEKRYHQGLLANLTGNWPVAATAFEMVATADPSIVSADLLARES